MITTTFHCRITSASAEYGDLHLHHLLREQLVNEKPSTRRVTFFPNELIFRNSGLNTLCPALFRSVIRRLGTLECLQLGDEQISTQFVDSSLLQICTDKGAARFDQLACPSDAETFRLTNAAILDFFFGRPAGPEADEYKLFLHSTAVEPGFVRQFIQVIVTVVWRPSEWTFRY